MRTFKRLTLAMISDSNPNRFSSIMMLWMISRRKTGYKVSRAQLY